VCVCSLSYPARKAHVPHYIVIYGLSGSTIFFPHYLINGTIFGKNYWTQICVFSLSLQLSFSLIRFSCNANLLQISDKDSNTKFHKNPFSGSRVVPFGMTGRQAWWRQKSLFAILRTRPKMGKFMPITTQIQNNRTSFWMGTIRSTTESMKGVNEMSRRSSIIACCAISYWTDLETTLLLLQELLPLDVVGTISFFE